MHAMASTSSCALWHGHTSSSERERLMVPPPHSTGHVENGLHSEYEHALYGTQVCRVVGSLAVGGRRYGRCVLAQLVH